MPCAEGGDGACRRAEAETGQAAGNHRAPKKAGVKRSCEEGGLKSRRKAVGAAGTGSAERDCLPCVFR